MGNRRKSISCLIFFILLPLALNLLAAGGKSPPPCSLDRAQAFLVIKDQIASRHPALFVSNLPVRGGSSIPTWGKTVTVPPDFGKAWFFFVDDQPQANWGHDCRYFFIDIQTGRFAVVSAHTPPDNWSEMTKFHPEK